MGRKYINRQGNEEFDQEIEEDIEDEEEKNNKLERLGPVLDIVDPFEIQLRQFSIEKDIERPKTKEEKVKEEIKRAGHQTRTTNQYQRLVNAHIEDRVSRIGKIKQAKEDFDRQVEALKGNEFTNLEKLENKSVEKLTSKSLEEMIKSLTLNYGLTKSKLEHFRNQVKETERELVEQKKHIDRIRNEFSKKKIEEESFDSDVNEIKNEISSLGEKYSPEELKKALETLMKSKELSD